MRVRRCIGARCPSSRRRPPMPAGAQSLSELVQAPDALARLLSQIGVVERDQGRALQGAACSRAMPGQPRRRSVALGRVHRDGRSADGGGRAVAPAQPARRSRRHDRIGGRACRRNAFRLAGRARGARGGGDRPSARCATRWRQAETEAAAARAALADAEKRHAQTAARTQSLNERHQVADVRRARGARTCSAQLAAELETLAPLAEFEARLGGVREEDLTTARASYSNAKARHDGVEREARARQQRLQAIAADLDAWNARIATATAQIEALTRARDGSAQRTCGARAYSGRDRGEAGAAARPAVARPNARARRRRDALAQAENAVKAAQSESRAADHALSHAREERARVRSGAGGAARAR